MDHQMNKFSIGKLILVVILFITACKNEGNKSTIGAEATATTPTTDNDNKALEGTGARDLSNVYVLSPAQAWPQVSTSFVFKSANLINAYFNTNGSDNIDFSKSDALIIVCDTTSTGYDFKVDSLNFNATPGSISVSTVKNDKIKSLYRPHYFIAVPKDKMSTAPNIRLNGKLISTTIID
jgi:hypothetical protein